MERFLGVDITDQEFFKINTIEDAVNIFNMYISKRYTLETIKQQKGEMI